MHDELCPSQVGESAYCLVCIWVAKARNDEREKAAQRIERLKPASSPAEDHFVYFPAAVSAARGGEQDAR